MPPPVPPPPVFRQPSSGSPRPPGRLASVAPGPVLPFAVLAAVALAALGLVRLSALTVYLTVDGVPSRVRSHAGTVAQLLVEQGVEVTPGDLVLPATHTRLGPEAAVRVQRARPVLVRADGESVNLRSHGRSAAAVLAEAGITLRPGDRVAVNGRPWAIDQAIGALPVAASKLHGDHETLPQLPRWSRLAHPAAAAVATDEADALLPGTDETWRIDVWRVVPVVVVEEGIPYTLPLAGPSVGQALTWAGLDLHPADQVHPSKELSLAGVRRVIIERATPFQVEADGAVLGVRARATTVGAALAAAGMPLQGLDYADPPADTPLTPGLAVRVVRVREEVVEEEVPIPFATVTRADPDRDLDDTAVVQVGAPGRRRLQVRLTFEDGRQTTRDVLEDEVLQPPIEQIVTYGTRIVWRTVDTPEGPKRYWRQMRVYATSYSLSRSGTSPNAPWYGFTRSGLPMRKGIVGVNRRVIPWLSNLYVPGYGIGLAADTGGGIGRYHIDLGYDDDNYQSWHWMVDLYLLEPLPAENRMIWLLP